MGSVDFSDKHFFFDYVVKQVIFFCLQHTYVYRKLTVPGRRKTGGGGRKAAARIFNWEESVVCVWTGKKKLSFLGDYGRLSIYCSSDVWCSDEKSLKLVKLGWNDSQFLYVVKHLWWSETFDAVVIFLSAEKWVHYVKSGLYVL